MSRGSGLHSVNTGSMSQETEKRQRGSHHKN